MSRLAKRVWLLGIWAGIGVLLGMQLAGSGGSAEKAPANSRQQIAQHANAQQQIPRKSSNTFTSKPEQEQVEVKDLNKKTPEQILLDNQSKPSVDVLADKTAGLLQNLSQQGIRLVVQLFSSVAE